MEDTTFCETRRILHLDPDIDIDIDLDDIIVNDFVVTVADTIGI